jgi:RNA polymerase sigma-70 factor (ECF subfamily)
VSSWWHQVLASAPSAIQTRFGDDVTVERIAGELLAAREKWPDATVDDDALAAVLGDHLRAQRDPAAALTRLRIDDLLLAQWCATGDPRAIAAFERAHKADVEGVLARFRRLAMTHEELLQILRIKLFVAVGEKPPRITEYSGFGFLQNWLRVTALRAMVDAARSEKARRLEELLADDDLLGVPALGPDIAARVSRDEVSRAIKQAFARAVSELAPRQRNFLRHAHVDQLTLEQIAATYGIHRATVARTLAQARADLVAATRSALAEQLGLDAAALDSVVRAADSRIDLSLSRVLRAPEIEDVDAEAP